MYEDDRGETRGAFRAALPADEASGSRPWLRPVEALITPARHIEIDTGESMKARHVLEEVIADHPDKR